MKKSTTNNSNKNQDESDIAGITFCFHNKTACCKRINDRFHDICILTSSKKKKKKKNSHNKILMEMKLPLSVGSVYTVIRLQQAMLEWLRSSSGWGDSNMVWESIVKHNEFVFRIMQTTQNWDAASQNFIRITRHYMARQIVCVDTLVSSSDALHFFLFWGERDKLLATQGKCIVILLSIAFLLICSFVRCQNRSV